MSPNTVQEPINMNFVYIHVYSCGHTVRDVAKSSSGGKEKTIHHDEKCAKCGKK